MRNPRPLIAWWQARRLVIQDGVPALILTLLAFVPQFEGAGVVLGGLPERQLDAWGVALMVTQSLALVSRRGQPLLCLLIVTTAFGVYQAIGYPPTVAGVGLYVALYSVGAHQDRFRLGAASAFTAAYAGLSVVLAVLGSPEDFLGFLTYFLVLLAFAGAGAWVRGRRAEEAERNRDRALAAITRERARIARELHDVVTHHVTAMVVQADAAQFLMAQPDRVVSGLGAVSDTGRRALTELRHLLDVLDASEDDAAGGRTPVVGRLVDLVEETRRAGLVVDMTEEGQCVALEDGVELAVYRVVQEGLTNAVKHARDCPTSVLIRYGLDRIDIEVSTLGPVLSETVPGRGLTGLRERVGLLGGELRAGARAGGGFTVAARIPARGAA